MGHPVHPVVAAKAEQPLPVLPACPCLVPCHPLGSPEKRLPGEKGSPGHREQWVHPNTEPGGCLEKQPSHPWVGGEAELGGIFARIILGLLTNSAITSLHLDAGLAGSLWLRRNRRRVRVVLATLALSSPPWAGFAACSSAGLSRRPPPPRRV